MYIKNTTKTFQSVNFGKNHFNIEPGGITVISDEDAKTTEYSLLMASGNAAPATEEEGREYLIKKGLIRDASVVSPIKVNTSHQGDKTNNIMLAECGAILPNGRRCGANVNVPATEYDKNALYFCTQHEGENKDDYEFVDGKWQKKVPEPVNSPVETPVETAETAAKPGGEDVGNIPTETQETPVQGDKKADTVEVKAVEVKE